MIQITKEDVVYKVPADIKGIQEVLADIPENVTILDAKDCHDLVSLTGIEKRPSLEALILENSGITSSELGKITDNILHIDVRGCAITSFSKLRERARAKPALNVLDNFRGERILNSIPDTIDYEIDGSFFNKPRVIVRKTRETNFDNQMIYA